MDMIGAKNRIVAFWTPAGTLHKEKWAQIKGETGMGAVRSAAMGGSSVDTPLARYSFRVNYDTSLLPDMHIRERDGTTLRILGIRHDKANREWTDVIAEDSGNGYS